MSQLSCPLNLKLVKNIEFLNWTGNHWKIDFLHTTVIPQKEHVTVPFVDSPLNDTPASFKFCLNDFLVPFGCWQLLSVVFLCCLKEPEVWTFVAFVYNKNIIWDRIFWLGAQYIFNAEQFFLCLQAHNSNNPQLVEGWKWSGWSGP